MSPAEQEPMELRQLRYFSAVAEELHFGLAAHKVCVAQPALSRQVRDLEAEIGVKLIDRRGRSCRVTEAGQVLAEHAARILADTERAIAAVRRAAQQRADRLRIGIAGDLAARHLGPIIQTWRSVHPAMGVELRAMMAAEQQVALDADELDLGFAPMVLSDEALVSEPMWQETLVITFPADNPLASAKSVDLVELGDTPILLPNNEPDLLALAKPLLADAGIGHSATHEAGSMTMLLMMVAAGLGIALVPEVVRHSVPEGVRLVPLHSPKASFEIGLLRRANETSPVALGFVEIATEVVRQRKQRTAGPARSKVIARAV